MTHIRLATGRSLLALIALVIMAVTMTAMPNVTAAAFTTDHSATSSSAASPHTEKRPPGW